MILIVQLVEIFMRLVLVPCFNPLSQVNDFNENLQKQNYDIAACRF